MDINKERELFEAYMAEKYKNLVDRRRCLNNGGGYMAWDMNVAWQVWQAAKAQAVPEKDAVIKKLSDQLYAQEMKASAARVLCETACELLDDYAHQDAMVILNDLEQAMKEPAND